MSYTFMQYALSDLPVVNRLEKEFNRAVGFLRYDHSNGRSTEFIYAVYNGQYKVAKVDVTKRANPDFDRKGRVWHDTNAIPADAVYCGVYVPTMFKEA